MRTDGDARDRGQWALERRPALRPLLQTRGIAETGVPDRVAQYGRSRHAAAQYSLSLSEMSCDQTITMHRKANPRIC